ncbi:hypothetical protein F442_03091 [Phytophthora nicotianae P10297]|uniref:Myb/SANT-like domain-containing protein n=3 Tax=Phytophthora nicotianae TaxID=4792 RepID=V9EBT2_PHYNI|nr:hypothetical protein F443_17321 [Phytophthora nicotianae P1569]ETM36686.1 hypothetical protein L914_16675 [Phytophthora nicotianae]ETP51825.1 hypothetical protein F442_03091 [Phytophthora nicotianae P10297]
MASACDSQRNEDQREDNDNAQPAFVEDRKRNWTDETTLALVQAWRNIAKEGRQKGEKTCMYNERIYNAYKAAVSTPQRSKKAIEDKLASLLEMCDFNANRIRGSTGKPNWFELPKSEMKQLRYSGQDYSFATSWPNENFSPLLRLLYPRALQTL